MASDADLHINDRRLGEGFDLSTPGDVVWPLTDNLGTVRDLAQYDSNTDTTTIRA